MSLKHGINLSLRTPNVLSRLRAAAGNEENISHYYQLLEQIVHDYQIDVSSNIGNLDETFIRFDLKTRKLLQNAMQKQSTNFQALLESSLSILLLWHLSPLLVSAFLLCLSSKAALEYLELLLVV